MSVLSHRVILERFINSLTLCENYGDILEVIKQAAKLAGIELPEHDSMEELREKLSDDALGLWND